MIGAADAVIICVPTPLSDEGGPDLRAVESSARTVADHLSRDTVVVLESTTYPGTTDGVMLPILEGSGLRHGDDFLLAYSPERVDPGSQKYGITNTPKLVGGMTPAATELPPPSTRGSSTPSSRWPAPRKLRQPSSWRTPTGM